MNGLNFNVNYLGLKLSSPLMPGASPLSDDLDVVRRLEDAGAGAIVLRSLFEEQVRGEHYASIYHMEMYADAFAEAASFFPGHDEFKFGPDEYLEQVRKVKEATHLPVIGSLNGTSTYGWLQYAEQIEQAGADALELNVYNVATNPQTTAAELEKTTLDVVREVNKKINIPLCVKLSPFFGALPNLATQLAEAGADGLVLFNRFYQPDIDLEALEVVPKLKLSDSSELLLRVRWLAILNGHTNLSLACSGGVHTAQDALKAVMAGAHGVQVVSALLRDGPEYLKVIKTGMETWMREHEYDSIRQLHGVLGLQRCPDPAAFERANYMRILNSWKGSMKWDSAWPDVHATD